MKKKVQIIFSSILLSIVIACSANINLFSDADEVKLGSQFDSEIKANPAEYPIYNNQSVKTYIKARIFDEVLRSPEIRKKDKYNYKLEIIDNDSVINAFAVPGGYIYLYTGLLKYLDSEAAVAGVIGHEIGHVENRHSTQRITKAYGFQILLSVVLGENPSEISLMVGNLFSGLSLLANSRVNEDEADEAAFRYLKGSRYYPGGVKFFFEKLRDEGKIASGGEGIATFLSTHPDPIERIETTNKRIKDAGIEMKTHSDKGAGIFKQEYRKNILSKM